jgi:hypothetical protein
VTMKCGSVFHLGVRNGCGRFFKPPSVSGFQELNFLRKVHPMWYACDLWLDYDNPANAILLDEETGEPKVFDTMEEALAYAHENAQDPDVLEV